MTKGEQRRRRPGFRLRVFGLLAILLTGAVGSELVLERAVLSERIDRRVERDHERERTEVEVLARGRDPRTGLPFDGDAEALFTTFLRRNVPGPGEVYLTFLGGQHHRSTAAPGSVQLHRLPRLADRWAGLETGARGWADTSDGAVRWLAAPVETGAGDPAGVFVVATFVDDQRREIDGTLRVEGAVSAVVLLAALAVGWSLAGRLLRPVRQITSSASSIRETDLTSRIPVVGNDEIAGLGRTYNAMLDRLQDAFETQRQFLDDAGHELRTPITIVRGHLEVMGDDPDERRETLALVTDELDRMSRMVSDLLVLARAERPDFLDVAPVEVEALTIGLFDRSLALGERRWVIDGCADVAVAADAQRLTQAVLNLARNAVEHTTQGDEIGIGSAWDGRELRLWVRDTGPGVPLADRDQIFGRFGRGRADRRRAEGAGLGLAIVTAIAHAHGGRVELDCPSTGGSVFTVVVPGVGVTARPTATEATTAPPVIGPDDPTRPQVVEEPSWPAS